MNQPNITPEFQIEIATTGTDSIVGIKPPVDNTFREQIFDVLNGYDLMKEVVTRDGKFFETTTAQNGEAYSELRLASTALEVAGVRLIDLAHMSKQVLTEQGRTAYVSPFLHSARNNRHLFSGI